MSTKIYTLTLTRMDRIAIDAVRDRYCTGDIYNVLQHGADCINEGDTNWFDDTDLTFEIQSWAAFSIVGLCALEGMIFPLWNPETVNTFRDFAESVTGSVPYGLSWGY